MQILHREDPRQHARFIPSGTDHLWHHQRKSTTAPGQLSLLSAAVPSFCALQAHAERASSGSPERFAEGSRRPVHGLDELDVNDGATEKGPRPLVEVAPRQTTAAVARVRPDPTKDSRLARARDHRLHAPPRPPRQLELVMRPSVHALSSQRGGDDKHHRPRRDAALTCLAQTSSLSSDLESVSCSCTKPKEDLAYRLAVVWTDKSSNSQTAHQVSPWYLNLWHRGSF